MSHRSAILRIALVLLLVLHCAWIASYFEPALFSPDAHGYLLQARLLATAGKTWFVPESDLQHIGIHWYETGSSRYYSHYPFGHPLLAAGLYWLLGPEAALLINVILASLSLLGFFLLCRLWVREGWALVATGAMAVNPVFNTHALNKDAHLATAGALVWGLYLLSRWSRSRAPALALVAGLLWGFLPTVRYPEILYGLIPLLFFLLHGQADRRTWQSYLAATLGALIPITALLWHNQLAFGAFWRTAYSLTKEQTAFSWGYFVQHFAGYIRGLLGEGAGLFFPLGVAGVAALGAQAATRKLGLLLVVALVPITALYMAYYWGGGPGPAAGGAMRFLIPTFFLYTLVGVFLLQTIAAQWPTAARIAIPALLLLHVAWGLPASQRALGEAEGNGARLAALSRWVEDQVEPGSLVIADAKLQEQLDLWGYWRLVDATAVGDRVDRGPFPPRALARRNAALQDALSPPRTDGPDAGAPARAAPPGAEQRSPAEPGLPSQIPEPGAAQPSVEPGFPEPGAEGATSAELDAPEPGAENPEAIGFRNRQNPRRTTGREGDSAIGPRAARQDRLERYRKLSPEQRLRRLAADLSAWAGATRRIYWIAPEEEFRSRRRELERIATFSVADSLELPAARFSDLPFGPAGAFPGQPDPGVMGPMRGEGIPTPQPGKYLLVEWRPR